MQLGPGTVPTLCTFIAFILGMLCLFAGSQKGILDGSGDILTLNTSKIGQTNSYGTANRYGASDPARELGIYDFYAIHVMSYCEGYFKTSDSGAAIRNVTGCSNRTVLFNFDPTEVLSGELKNGVNLADLNWSGAIDDDFQVLSTTTKAMAILYCIGTGAAGLAVFAGAWLVLTGGRTQAIAELFLSILGFIALGTSSAIATVMAMKFVDLINRHGKNIGVSATRGNQFLGMTWAAVGLLLIAILSSLLMVVGGGQAAAPPPADEPAKEAE
ncbi:hypothetical protein Plec18167_001210 [Paecilomyces lecythidis]|uniref:Actin cortical patch SUR7/pH-response regulator PalI n=1 Tax=Paecilomyces lecythidis TaxID=3004212 RepID=A0ABR3YBM8_9EURO